MEINTSKTKEMVLGRLANTNSPLSNIASQTVETVTAYKYLGVHIDSTLFWSTHIEHIIKKATTRLYFLKQLKRAGLPNSHLLHFYITVIMPVLEYCAPVWHYALTKAQFESLDSVQKRAIHITQNLTRRGMPYSSMLLHINLDSLVARKEDLSRRFPVILWILPPVFTASFLHTDPPLSPLGSVLLKSFLKSILVPSAMVPLYNMVLTTTSKPAFLPCSLFDYLSYY